MFMIVSAILIVFVTVVPTYMDRIAHGSWFWTRPTPQPTNPVNTTIHPRKDVM